MTNSIYPTAAASMWFSGRSTIDTLPRMSILTGKASFFMLREVETERPPGELVPSDFALSASADEPGTVDLWFEGPRGGLLLQVTGFSCRVTVTGADKQTVEQVHDEVRRAAGTTTMHARKLRVWRQTENGPYMDTRPISAEPWEVVRHNYPTASRSVLDGLMAMTEPAGRGQLVLWHGEPGTGKTSAVLALLDAWYPWCAAHVISDPERMFGDADYLLQVMSRTAPIDEGPLDVTKTRTPRWKLIICEDADEYLRSDARARSGPALGRLLNATDGLVGRGTRTLVLLTTNDELGRLHPAVTRPGRCLNVLEFPRFSAEEAAVWLKRPVPTHSATLAELYALKDHGAELSEPLRTGHYL